MLRDHALRCSSHIKGDDASEIFSDTAFQGFQGRGRGEVRKHFHDAKGNVPRMRQRLGGNASLVGLLRASMRVDSEGKPTEALDVSRGKPGERKSKPRTGRRGLYCLSVPTKHPVREASCQARILGVPRLEPHNAPTERRVLERLVGSWLPPPRADV